jgi:predicted dehydrogenase
MDSVLMPECAPETGTLPPGEPGAVGLGVIGLGAFGRFCLEAYATMPGIRVVAIADSDPDALAVGTNLAPQALACADRALLLGLPEVEAVAICTPPDQHLGLVLAAVVAGKHIVCDKPLGVSLAEYDTAVAAAAARGVALGLNLVLRHHSLYHALHGLAQSRVLGAPRHLAVENYADEGRKFGPEHWLWDPARSGGLALASDIHWLDLATRLLGPAHEVHTWEHTASEGGVLGPCRLVTTAHPCGAVASVYHAFDTRPGATGCTVLVAFEEGEARVDGWMPRRLTVACPLDRMVAVSTLLGATGVPAVSSAEDNRALLTLQSGADRRSDYLEMVRTALRVVLAQVRGQGEGTDLATARAATATALAAELAAVARAWVRIDANGPLEATGVGQRWQQPQAM